MTLKCVSDAYFSRRSHTSTTRQEGVETERGVGAGLSDGGLAAVALGGWLNAEFVSAATASTVRMCFVGIDLTRHKLSYR